MVTVCMCLETSRRYETGVEGTGKLDLRRRGTCGVPGIQLDCLGEGRGRVVEKVSQDGVVGAGRAPVIQFRSCPFCVDIRVFWHLGERVRQAKK